MASETGLNESEVRNYFEIVMAECEGGTPDDYSQYIASEIRRLLNEGQSAKNVAFHTGASMEDVSFVKDEIERPMKEQQAMRGWKRTR
jgi:hypothetical protein